MTSANTIPNRIGCRVAAATRILEDYEDFIRNVIRTHVRDEDQVGDLFQIFFLSLVRNPLPDGVDNVEGYLFKAVTNSIVDTNRRTGRYLDFINAHAELSEDSASQKTAHDLLVQAEEARRIFALIEQRLPHGEARALTLRYREQHNAKEAAEKMGVSTKTLRAYICEGLGRIRRLLRNIEPDVAE